MHNWYIDVFVGIYGAQQNANMNISCQFPIWEYVIAAQITHTEIDTQKQTYLPICFATIFIYIAAIILFFWLLMTTILVLIIPNPLSMLRFFMQKTVIVLLY